MLSRSLAALIIALTAIAPALDAAAKCGASDRPIAAADIIDAI